MTAIPPHLPPLQTAHIEEVDADEPHSPFFDASASMAIYFSRPVLRLEECWATGLPPALRIPAWIANRPLPQAAPDVKHMTGVVIWPRDLESRAEATRADQSSYGLHIYEGIQRAAQALREGSLPTLLDLWNLAREIRQMAPADATKGIFKSRHPSVAGSFANSAFTEITGRYQYIADRVRSHPDFTTQNDTLAPRRGNLVTPEGRVRNVELTRFILRPDLDSPNLRAQNVPEAFARIDHPESNTLLDVLHHAEGLYRKAMGEEDDARFCQLAAKLYWWLAHAMPDERGSAAKTEICYRALHAAHGLLCPLWRPGVSADIEAMLRTEAEWLESFETLQQR